MISSRMSNYDKVCDICPYRKGMHLEGTIYKNIQYTPLKLESNSSRILLVFQSPGEEEWKNGKAILSISKQGGTAGKRIENSWNRTNMKRDDFDITNVVQCFPGKGLNGRDNIPQLMAICKCKERLEYVIKNGKYKKIISFGSIANEVISNIHKRNNSSFIHIQKNHPSGGVTNDELDKLWRMDSTL